MLQPGDREVLVVPHTSARDHQVAAMGKPALAAESISPLAIPQCQDPPSPETSLMEGMVVAAGLGIALSQGLGTHFVLDQAEMAERRKEPECSLPVEASASQIVQ